MVAKITTPKNVNKAIYYNEHKVSKKDAALIHAEGFIIGHKALTMIDKKMRFHLLNARHQTIEANTLHVSINFPPEEKLTHAQYLTIAADYMQRIGFGGQPYLVYEHLDAGHPHFHIVSTSIRVDGTVIDMKFIGRDKSEPARIAIEEEYGLIKAKGRGKGKPTEPIVLDVQRLQYGKSETKQGITNVLKAVLTRYKYTSLAELNALLREYGIRADPGKPGGRIYQHGGLVYQMIDDNQKAVGVPIKSSSIYFKPGLKYLGKKFEENAVTRGPDLDRLRTYIDLALRSHPRDFAAFSQWLRGEQIHVVPYMTSDGMLYGLTFIDHKTKAIATGSTLGKAYSAKAIMRRMGMDQYARPLLAPFRTLGAKFTPQNGPFTIDPQEQSFTQSDINTAIHILMRQEGSERLPFELKREQKKR